MGFIEIKFIDAIDIFLVAVLMYYLYRLVRRTNAVNIFIGIVLICAMLAVARAAGMELTGMILGQIVGMGAIAILVVFQPEIRKFLLIIGARYSGHNGSLWKKIFSNIYSHSSEWMTQLSSACKSMSETNTGALIVISKKSNVAEFARNGIVLDSALNKLLLESIFSKTSPLHDGAVIITDGRIKAAGCILPVSYNTSVPAYFGTRHRAAMGASEVADVVVVVVSEERGEISVFEGGEVISGVSAERLTDILANSLK